MHEVTHVVQSGDCISSIAESHGLGWESVWNHPKNAELKALRKSPSLLAPGDEVVVPARETRTEDCPTEERHRFRKKGVPAKLRVRLMERGKARAGESYVLSIGGQLIEGQVAYDGLIEEWIPPTAKRAELIVGEDEDRFELDLGQLPPADELAGQQARLENLGYPCGRPDGRLGPKTTAALRAFQEAEGLEVSGEPDGPTRDALVEAHGS